MLNWSSVFLQTLIIDVATLDDSNKDTPQEFDNQRLNYWLGGIIDQVASVPDTKQEVEDGIKQGHNLQAAENLLFALLQLETSTSINGAHHLLHREWRGQKQLSEIFWNRFDLLGNEEQKRWIELINPPQRGELLG